MRTGLAIDASCDLSQAFIERHQVAILPITINVDGETFQDDRSPAEIQRFIHKRLGSRSHTAETAPCTPEEVQALFLDKLVLECDSVFCLTIMASRSPINENANKAGFLILKNYRETRERAGVNGSPFTLRVIDTRNLFAGSAPVIWEAARLIAADESSAAIRERLLHVADCCYGYMLPRDLQFLRQRAKKKNDRSVGFMSAMLGSALDIKPIIGAHQGETGAVAKAKGWEQGADLLLRHTAERVRAGLVVPMVCVTYGGDLAVISHQPAFAELEAACAEHGVELMQAPMSITGMVNVGEGALAVGFASEDYTAKF